MECQAVSTRHRFHAGLAFRLAAPIVASVALAGPAHSQPGAHVEISEGSATLVLEGPAEANRYLLPVDIEAVKSVYQVDNRIVIIGNITDSGDSANAVVVFDASGRRILGEFYGYGVTPSPDGRLLAYIRFYPMHFTAGTDDQVFVHDVAADDGSLPGPSDADAAQTGLAAGLQLRVDAGQPRKGANAEVPSASRHLLASRLFWDSTGSAVAFVQAIDGSDRLVVARRTGPQKWRVRGYAVQGAISPTAELDISAIATPSPVLEASMPDSAGHRNAHRVELADLGEVDQ
jgi:hypothetical protein